MLILTTNTNEMHDLFMYIYKYTHSHACKTHIHMYVHFVRINLINQFSSYLIDLNLKKFENKKTSKYGS